MSSNELQSAQDVYNTKNDYRYLKLSSSKIMFAMDGLINKGLRGPNTGGGEMKSLRLWWVIALILSISLFAVAPREAMAGKGLGITKKAYLKTYNQQLSRLFGLRFEKFGESTKNEDNYKLSNDTAYLSLKPGNSEQLSEVIIIVMNVEGRPENEFIAIMNLGVAIAVEPNPTTNTINLFTKKFKDKVEQGLNDFSFEMGDKIINIEIKKPSAIFVTIKPL